MEIKPIKGFEGLYEISEFGDVFSTKKTVVSGKGLKCVREYERRKKAIRKDKYGYLRTSLSKKGIVKTYSVHRLVALTFVKGDSSLTVNHIDGNKLNNHYSNLEFISSCENLKHAFSISLKKPPTAGVGTENKKSKLNKNQVKEIRESNLSLRKLANAYNVHHSVIFGIKKGTRYFNIK